MRKQKHTASMRQAFKIFIFGKDYYSSPYMSATWWLPHLQPDGSRRGGFNGGELPGTTTTPAPPHYR